MSMFSSGEVELDLNLIYRELTTRSLIRTPKINRDFHKFAELLATKSSFAARVHKNFSICHRQKS